MTKQQILDWTLFNTLVFNYDAHGKNISFYVSAKGLSLAPFYDLVNIKMYPDFEQEWRWPWETHSMQILSMPINWQILLIAALYNACWYQGVLKTIIIKLKIALDELSDLLLPQKKKVLI